MSVQLCSCYCHQIDSAITAECKLYQSIDSFPVEILCRHQHAFLTCNHIPNADWVTACNKYNDRSITASASSSNQTYVHACTSRCMLKSVVTASASIALNECTHTYTVKQENVTHHTEALTIYSMQRSDIISRQLCNEVTANVTLLSPAV